MAAGKVIGEDLEVFGCRLHGQGFHFQPDGNPLAAQAIEFPVLLPVGADDHPYHQRRLFLPVEVFRNKFSQAGFVGLAEVIRLYRCGFDPRGALLLVGPVLLVNDDFFIRLCRVHPVQPDIRESGHQCGFHPEVATIVRGKRGQQFVLFIHELKPSFPVDIPLVKGLAQARISLPVRRAICRAGFGQLQNDLLAFGYRCEADQQSLRVEAAALEFDQFIADMLHIRIAFVMVKIAVKKQVVAARHQRKQPAFPAFKAPLLDIGQRKLFVRVAFQ